MSRRYTPLPPSGCVACSGTALAFLLLLLLLYVRIKWCNENGLKRRGIKNVSGWEITEYAQAGILRGIMLY
jgi:hypothetical protein